MVDVAVIVGALVLALIAGLIIFKLVKLTIDLIKKFRKRKDTKEALIQGKALIAEIANNPKYKHMKFSDLNKINKDSVIVAEIDNDEIVGKMECFDKIDDEVIGVLDDDGVVVLEE